MVYQRPSDYKGHSVSGRRDCKTSGKGRQNLEDLFRDIRGRNVGLRMAALETLRQTPRKHGRPILELANAVEGDVRVLACGLIADVKPNGALRVLVEKTRDRDPNVREAACKALGRFRSPRAVKSLIEALHDETWTAYAAVWSLGEIGGEQALQQLLTLFRKGDYLTATAACQVILARNDTRLNDQIVDTLRQWPQAKRDSFVRIVLEDGGDDILYRLRHLLGDNLFTHLRYLVQGEEKVRMSVLYLVAQFENLDAVNLMLQELTKRDPGEDEFQKIIVLLSRLHAVWEDCPEAHFGISKERGILAMVRACTVTRTKISEECLLHILSRSRLETIREIAKNLTFIAEASPRIMGVLLYNMDDHVRGYAAEAALFFGMNEFVPRIEELARTGHADTRQKAFRSLATLSPGSAKILAEELTSQGKSEDAKIYLSAVDSIHSVDKELNYHLIPRLLCSRDNSVVAMTVRAMGKLIKQDPRYIAMIEELLYRKRALPETLEIIEQHRLKNFLPRLLDLLNEFPYDPWTRYRIVSVLAAMEDGSLVDLFAAGLEDEHNLVKIASIKALARLRHPRAADLIRPLMTSADTDLSHAALAAMNALSSGDENYAHAGKP